MRLTYAVINPKLTTQSSILMQPLHVRWAWLSLVIEGQIADGEIAGLTAFQLSRLATITLEQAEESMKIFLEPDPYSACRENDGRRLELVDEVTSTYRLVSYEFQQGLIAKARESARKRAAYVSKRSAEELGEPPEITETAGGQPEKTGSILPPSPLPLPSPLPKEEKESAAFREAENLRGEIDRLNLVDNLPDNLLVAWVEQYGADMIRELIRTKPLNGKRVAYLSKILESWHVNPSERPSAANTSKGKDAYVPLYVPPP